MQRSAILIAFYRRTGSCFKTVNSNSIRFILSEGHRKMFALALLDPACWFYFDPWRASIHYRLLQTYLTTFQFYKISKWILIDEERAFARPNERHLSQQIREIFSKARTIEYPEPALEPILRKRTAALRNRYIVDYRQTERI